MGARSLIDRIVPGIGLILGAFFVVLPLFVPSAEGTSNVKRVLLAEAASDLESSSDGTRSERPIHSPETDFVRLAARGVDGTEKKNRVQHRSGLRIAGHTKHTKIS